MEECIYIVQSGQLNLYLLDKVSFYPYLFTVNIYSLKFSWECSFERIAEVPRQIRFVSNKISSEFWGTRRKCENKNLTYFFLVVLHWDEKG